MIDNLSITERFTADYLHGVAGVLRGSADVRKVIDSKAFEGSAAHFRNVARCMAAPTAVFDLHLHYEAGLLAGQSAEELLRDYRRTVGDSRLLESYRVLRQRLIGLVRRRVAAAARMGARLVRDRSGLEDMAGGRIGRAIVIRPVGDLHAPGECVTKLSFESGFECIYKPRPARLEYEFQRLLGRVNDIGFQPELSTIACIPRRGHGWFEWHEPSDAVSTTQIVQRYARLGGGLAVLYLLGAVDIHFENIVAAAENVYFVDAETLLHPRIAHLTRRVLSPRPDSLHSVGILPYTSTSGPDLSVLGVWRSSVPPPTVRFEIVAGPLGLPVLQVHTTLANIARSGQARADPRLLQSFSQAFSTMYGLLRDRRSVLTDWLRDVRGMPSRTILRDTAIYQQLMTESFWPPCMTTRGEHKATLRKLPTLLDANGRADSELYEHEIADLAQDLVPRFSSLPSARNVSHGSHTLAFKAMASGLEVATRRIAEMRPATMDALLREIHECWPA